MVGYLYPPATRRGTLLGQFWCVSVWMDGVLGRCFVGAILVIARFGGMFAG